MSDNDTRTTVAAKAGDWVELRCGWIIGPLVDSEDGDDFPLVCMDSEEPSWSRSGKYLRGDTTHELDIVAIVPRPTGAVKADDSPRQSDAASHSSRYHRTFRGVTLDLYRVANLWGVTSHPLFHAMKKIMLAGERGPKSRETDLREAIVAIQEELKIMSEEAANGPH